MFYLVAPMQPLRFSDLLFETIVNGIQEYGIDLSRIEWTRFDRPVTDDLVRLTVRNGFPVLEGIIVKATALVPETRPLELRKLVIESAQTQAELVPKLAPHEDLMESLIPGWKESGRELDRRVAEAMAKSIREADQELAEELAAPVKQDLVDHWKHLGGNLPEPL